MNFKVRDRGITYFYINATINLIRSKRKEHFVEKEIYAFGRKGRLRLRKGKENFERKETYAFGRKGRLRLRKEKEDFVGKETYAFERKERLRKEKEDFV